jgi:hypothetical protein
MLILSFCCIHIYIYLCFIYGLKFDRLSPIFDFTVSIIILVRMWLSGGSFCFSRNLAHVLCVAIGASSHAYDILSELRRWYIQPCVGSGVLLPSSIVSNWAGYSPDDGDRPIFKTLF